MRRTEDKPNAIRAATSQGLFENLQSYAVQMEKIQRSLDDYFETKRLLFPRLYFLSNEELLEILSTTDLKKIQPHINKCFGSINKLETSTKSNDITHLISFENESFELMKSVRVRGATEQWLGALENQMFESIKKHIKNAFNDIEKLSLKDWILKQPGQVVLLISQINFNKQIIKCLTSTTNDAKPNESLRNYLKNLIDYLNSVTNIVSNEMPISKILTVENLLTIEVHARDILNGLIDYNVS
jgi:dynein heavy chain, axonemal